MPTIPTARKRVQAQGTRQVNLSTVSDTRAFGGGDPQHAKQVQGILGTVDKIRIEQRNKAEQTQLRELQAKETSARNGMMNDKKFGFLNTRGKQSAESFDGYSENYDKFVNEEANGITSERVREQYNAYTTQAKNQMSAQMNRHAGPQMQAYEKDTALSLVASLKEESISNPDAMTLPDKDGNITSVLRQNIERSNQAIADVGKSQGMSQDRIKLLQLEATTGVHEGVINKFVNSKRDKDAKAWLEKAKSLGEIDQKTLERLEKTIAVSSVRGDSQRETDQIIRQDMSMKDSLKKAREITDPEVRDATVRRVKQRLNEKKQVATIEKQDAFNKAIENVYATKSTDGLTSEEISNLSGKRRDSLNKVMDYISQGLEPPNDPVAYNDLMILASTPELKEKFLQTDINEHAHELSNANRQKLVARQVSLRDRMSKSAGKDDAEFKGFLSDTKVVSTSLAEAGIKDKKKIAEFNQKVNEKVIEWKEANDKKKMPQKDFQSLVDSMLFKVNVVDGGFMWFDKEKSIYELEGGEEISSVDVDDIPAKDLQFIRQALAKAGQNFTDDAAIAMYQRKLNKVIN